MGRRLHLAVALDGAGWHPAAWREPSARPGELLDARYWADLVQTAERGVIDFVTFEDALTLQSANPFVPDDRVDQVRGRLDASLLATRVAPVTTHIGLVPTVTTTHTEPFHVSTRIATLDHVSGGRAGWRVQTLKQRAEVAHFGRRTLPDESADESGREPLARLLFDEAADSVDVARRLWDSWEDDAEIRDRATGRFIDRDKLHSIDFEGRFFSVRGPSITPRPPQGQPVITVLGHGPPAYELAARSADVVFVTPQRETDVASLVGAVRDAEVTVGRDGRPLSVFADLVVVLDDDAARARDTKARLDEFDGEPLRSDAAILATSPDEVADLLVAWHTAGLDGFRFRPARLPADLDAIVDRLVPELHARGAFPDSYDETTLRARLGLGDAPNRYAASVSGRDT